MGGHFHQVWIFKVTAAWLLPRLSIPSRSRLDSSGSRFFTLLRCALQEYGVSQHGRCCNQKGLLVDAWQEGQVTAKLQETHATQMQ